MNMHAPGHLPAMAELTTANHLLDDHAALAQAWDRDGYWFFRDVLDRDAIARIRQVYADYVVEMGLADPNDPAARYNGKDYAHLPINSNQTRLNEIKAHRLLHEDPAINAFFARLFGCDPFWLPFTVHRTNPPVADRSKSRFDFIHADNVYNVGMPFMICWVPLDEIDAEVGGLALLEGLHRQPSLHRQEGLTIHPIALEDVPPQAWRRADYRPGDVLLMDRCTPHSGLSNVSRDRFRFSMDTRIMPSSGNVPLVGHVTEVIPERIVVVDGAGEHVLRFGPDSFVRGTQGNRLAPADVAASYPPGSPVIVACAGDLIVNMRPHT